MGTHNKCRYYGGLHSQNKIELQEYVRKEKEILKRQNRLKEIDEDLRRTNAYANIDSLLIKWGIWGAIGIFVLCSNLGTIRNEGIASLKLENGIFSLLVGIMVLLWPVISGIYIVSDVRLYYKSKQKRQIKRFVK